MSSTALLVTEMELWNITQGRTLSFFGANWITIWKINLILLSIEPEILANTRSFHHYNFSSLTNNNFRIKVRTFCVSFNAENFTEIFIWQERQFIKLSLTSDFTYIRWNRKVEDQGGDRYFWCRLLVK